MILPMRRANDRQTDRETDTTSYFHSNIFLTVGLPKIPWLRVPGYPWVVGPWVPVYKISANPSPSQQVVKWTLLKLSDKELKYLNIKRKHGQY